MAVSYQSAAEALRNAICDMQLLPSSRKVAIAITNAEQALLWLESATSIEGKGA